MATQADVRRIASSFRGAEEAHDRFAFSVRDNKGKAKGVADLRILIEDAWRCQAPKEPPPKSAKASKRPSKRR